MRKTFQEMHQAFRLCCPLLLLFAVYCRCPSRLARISTTHINMFLRFVMSHPADDGTELPLLIYQVSHDYCAELNSRSHQAHTMPQTIGEFTAHQYFLLHVSSAFFHPFCLTSMSEAVRHPATDWVERLSWRVGVAGP
ncbi:hypothetical protein B0H17DRAFT_108982 [Mycena rosella]|uniref:Secreted protein n=1 Tax=Mycena rosella TaxID=1033263 RepID=A0AAD7D424_MYCRO|nr:hypothetical protein B0H17DRAFT_108982 [Mycena rosella]